jgi:hypothetical protein
MQLKFIKWDAEIPKSADEPVDEEEYVFDASDYMYRLMALTFADELTTNPKTILKQFIAGLGCEKVITDKRAKIEDADELWANIKTDVGAEHAAVIIPILKGE